jgi:hypothetical protein
MTDVANYVRFELASCPNCRQHGSVPAECACNRSNKSPLVMHSIQDHACSRHVATSSRESGHLAGRPIVNRTTATRSDPVLRNFGHLAMRTMVAGQSRLYCTSPLRLLGLRYFQGAHVVMLSFASCRGIKGLEMYCDAQPGGLLRRSCKARQ